MRVWRCLGRNGLIMLLLALAPAAAGAEDPPTPAGLRTGEELRRYLQQAETFLAKEPGHAEAPRVALDVVVVGQWVGREEIANRARQWLLFQHPDTPQSLHVAKGFGDAEAYTDFALESASQLMQGNEVAPLAVRMYHLDRLGRRAFGHDAMNSETGFLLTLVTLLEGASRLPDAEERMKTLAAQGRSSAMENLERSRRAAEAAGIEEERRSAWLRVGPVLLSETLSHEERVLALAAMADHPSIGRAASQALDAAIMALPQQDRMSSAVAQVRLARAYDAGRFEEVIALEAAMPPAGDAALQAGRRVWRGIALAALERRDEAQQVLGEVADADQPISPLAGELAAAIAAHTSSVPAHLAALEQGVNLLADVEAVEAQITVESAADTFHLYGLDATAQDGGRRLILQARQEDRSLFAFRLEGAEAHVFDSQSGVTSIYDGFQALPGARITLHRIAAGGPVVSFFVGAGDGSRGLLPEVQRWQSDPRLRDLSAITELVQQAMAAGCVPMPPAQDESGRTVFRWIVVQAWPDDMENPKHWSRSLEFSFDPEGRLSGIATGSVTARLRTAAAGSDLEPELPAWPESPTERRDGRMPFLTILPLAELVRDLAYGDPPKGEASGNAD